MSCQRPQVHITIATYVATLFDPKEEPSQLTTRNQPTTNKKIGNIPIIQRNFKNNTVHRRHNECQTLKRSKLKMT